MTTFTGYSITSTDDLQPGCVVISESYVRWKITARSALASNREPVLTLNPIDDPVSIADSLTHPRADTVQVSSYELAADPDNEVRWGCVPADDQRAVMTPTQWWNVLAAHHRAPDPRTIVWAGPAPIADADLAANATIFEPHSNAVPHPEFRDWLRDYASRVPIANLEHRKRTVLSCLPGYARPGALACCWHLPRFLDAAHPS
ncbi:hypothetical protein KUTG_09985 [Kutzneria sp. 744]|nr:hypothetical protein KUTG_09985 [Kutzneria sp. 744]